MTRFPLRPLPCSALVVWAAIASGCGDDGTAGAGAAGSQLSGTRWTLDASPVHSWITFERDQAGGNDGCNTFSGSYEATGSKLTFGPLAGTNKLCGSPADEVARTVLAGLAQVRSYETAGDTLRMQDGSGKTLLTYAADTAGVEGGWTVLSVLYDDAIRSAVADHEPTADFSADGTIGGGTGCNRFHGPYTLEGSRIDIGPLSATKKACATKEASEQEAGYLAALESAVRIEQAGPQLTLFNAEGQMAVTLTRR